jgi:integrase
VTGVPRNPIPSRSLLHAEKTTRGLSEEQVGLLLAAICRSMRSDPRAPRDYVLVKGSYLLGCRVGELARLKWEDVERLKRWRANPPLSARDLNQEWSALAGTRWLFSNLWAAAKTTAISFQAHDAKRI